MPFFNYRAERVECDTWAWPNRTPNEAYAENDRYRAGIDEWCRQCRQPGPHHWHQVRIVKDLCSLDEKENWWTDGPWASMNAIFWVFMKPYYAKFEGKPYGFYCLELVECQRVLDYRIRTHGKSGYANPSPMLMIPVEICKPCRYETTNGYSDHLRPREIIVPTQQEIDHEETMKELVAEKTKEVIETVNDPRYSKLVDADGKQIIH